MKKYIRIQKSLLKWFNVNKRDLPWRKNRTWYKVWISEIMLQQTQVEQAKSYYSKFLKEFPHISDLASADLQKVLKIWEGLGYYSRARNMHQTAKIIVEKHKQKFPSTKSEIIKLPGIGEYTSHALLSFVYNKPFATIDGNVKRVISRLFGIRENIQTNLGLKQIKEHVNLLMPKNNAANFNEALMELGALICNPKNPLCQTCPVNNCCTAFQNNLIDLIPIKSKSRIKPQRLVIVQILKKGSKINLFKRREKGLLGGFWEFPFLTIENISELKTFPKEKRLKTLNHVYTHFSLKMYPVYVDKKHARIDSKIYEQEKWIDINELPDYPVHGAMQKVLKLLFYVNSM